LQKYKPKERVESIGKRLCNEDANAYMAVSKDSEAHFVENKEDM